MLSKNQIKYINSLKIKKFRQDQGVFLVEGEKCVTELLNSNLEVTGVYALRDWLDENRSFLISKSIIHTETDEAGLAKISDLTTPNKVVALARIPKREFSAELYQHYILALDNIKDPGNMGTIIRTADWFGIRHVVCSYGCVDAYNPKVIQATMGSITRVNIYYLELLNFITQKPEGTPVYGALLSGESLNNTVFDTKGILIIGSESHGISSEVIPMITNAVHIPSFSHNEAIMNAESLNASIANAIICYEMSKQLFEKKS
jgi:TrmH family RNA methyltransferase